MALQVVDMHGAIPDGLAREYLCRRDGIDKDGRSAALAFNRSFKLVFAYVHGRMFQVVRFYIIAAALQRRRLLVATGPDRLGFLMRFFHIEHLPFSGVQTGREVAVADRH
jgi:hypothetical protein